MIVIDLITHLFAETWNLINGVQVPGLSFTFGNVFTGCIIISASFKIMTMFFGIGGGEKTSGGNNKNIKVSKDREGDQK